MFQDLSLTVGSCPAVAAHGGDEEGRSSTLTQFCDYTAKDQRNGADFPTACSNSNRSPSQFVCFRVGSKEQMDQPWDILRGDFSPGNIEADRPKGRNGYPLKKLVINIHRGSLADGKDAIPKGLLIFGSILYKDGVLQIIIDLLLVLFGFGNAHFVEGGGHVHGPHEFLKGGNLVSLTVIDQLHDQTGTDNFAV